jgi:hypothetical protein
MKKHPVLIAAVTILLLGLAAGAAILYATQPGWLGSPPEVPVAQPAPVPGASDQAPGPHAFTPEPGRPSPTSPLPVPEWYKPGDPPVIQAAPAPPMPKKREERQQLEIDQRKQKFASAMDALNRRTAAKVGNTAPLPPSTPPAPAAYNSRRGILSPAEPAQQPQAQQGGR